MSANEEGGTGHSPTQLPLDEHPWGLAQHCDVLPLKALNQHLNN